MRKLTSGVSRLLPVFLLVGCFSGAALSSPDGEVTKTDRPAAFASQPNAAPAATAPAAILGQATSPGVNPVTQAAVQAGVLVCVSRINQVTTFLSGSNKSSAFLFVPQRQPDQSIFSVSLGIEGDNTAARYASASFAPTISGQAGAVYDTVEYVAQSCAEVEAKAFKDLKRKGNLGKDIVILDGGSVTVFLMPAGSGCIVIKKEVVQ